MSFSMNSGEHFQITISVKNINFLRAYVYGIHNLKDLGHYLTNTQNASREKLLG